MMNSIEILLVEDNSQDAELTLRTLKKNKLANSILHLSDGQEALDYLEKPENGIPKVILLDLKMPRVDGIDVLRRIKSNERLKIIPVVVLTSSRQERDVIESYKLGVNAYIVKPVDFEQFVKAITDVGLFWLVLNQSPEVK